MTQIIFQNTTLPPNVRRLGFVSFFNDAASEMIYPLLPIFLATALGAGAVSLGVIEGLAEAVVSLFKLVSGRLSDGGRRKPWALWGYGLSNLVRPAVALATAWPQVLALRLADRLGKGLRTSPRDALIADSIEPGRRGRAFGFHRAMDHAGAVVGPLLASAFLAFAPGRLRLLFALSIVPGLAAWVLLATAVREPASPRPIERRPRAPCRWADLSPELKFYLRAMMLFTLGNSSDAFLILKARDAGIPVAGIPLLWSALHVVKSTTTYWGGVLSDRWGRRNLLSAGWLFYAAVYAGLAGMKGPRPVAVLLVVYGVYFGLTEGVERALIADHAPPDRKGTVFGIYHAASGLGALAASLLFGGLWQWRGESTAFAAGAALAAAAVIALNLRRPERWTQPRAE